MPTRSQNRAPTVRARTDLAADLVFILIGALAAVALAQTGVLDSLLDLIGRNDAAAFVSGVFFTSAFTMAPAAIALVRIGSAAPIGEVALWGALGAMCGDLIIFFFIRDRFADDLLRSLRPSFAKHVLASFHLGFLKWLAPLLGAFVIVSPLPDEVGLALMGISRTRVALLMPISFAMNWLGITGLVYLAHAL